MQNEQTLIDLGFRRLNRTGEWFFRGNNQKYTAKDNGDGSVNLYRVCQNVDYRPLSPNYGYNFRHLVHTCISDGSVERNIKQFDLPDDMIINVIGGCIVKRLNAIIEKP